MASRTMHVTNNYGQSVRVRVHYQDGHTDAITLDDNDTKSFAITEATFMEPHQWGVQVAVYRIGKKVPSDSLSMEIEQNEVNVIIKIGDDIIPLIFVE